MLLLLMPYFSSTSSKLRYEENARFFFSLHSLTNFARVNSRSSLHAIISKILVLSRKARPVIFSLRIISKSSSSGSKSSSFCKKSIRASVYVTVSFPVVAEVEIEVGVSAISDIVLRFYRVFGSDKK
jgi:hypothetical protein